MYERKPDVAMRIRQRMTAGVSKSCAAGPHPACPGLTLQDVDTLIVTGARTAPTCRRTNGPDAQVFVARGVSRNYQGSTEADRIWSPTMIGRDARNG